jgi:hypothetical protein
MESESPSIDPRYRPEFQRGYHGSAVPVPVPTALVPPVSTNRAGEPIRVEAIQVEPIRPGLPPAPGTDAESPAVVDPPAIESEPAKRRRNPYFLVIPLLGVGSVILGGWLTVSQWITNFSARSGSSDTVESRFGQAMTFAFSGPLVTVGLSALFGFGFWLALRKRP